MNNPLLSIIVPIYNVEPYLEDCLLSIVTQLEGQDEVEVILVNDCSSDQSGTIAARYAEEYEQLKYFSHQQNEGVSIARNTGINAANGSWVWFIDSVDWIEKDAIKTLLQLIEEHQEGDIICIQKKNDFQEYSIVNDIIPSPMSISGKQYLRSKLQKGVVVKFVAKRQFLLAHHLFFYPHILHEDNLYNYIMLYYAKKLYVSDKPLYVKRCIRPGSIMNSIGERNAYDLMTIHRQLMIFMDKTVSQDDKDWFFKLSFLLICRAYRIIGRTPGFSVFQDKNREYVKSVCQEAFRYKGISFKAKVLFVRFFPRILPFFEDIYSALSKR